MAKGIGNNKSSLRGNMEKFEKSMAIFVAYLRAISLLHQNNHWTCQSALFYQHHKLLDELYNSAQADADEAAEKIVGLFGCGVLDLQTQMSSIKSILDKQKDSSPMSSSLTIEEEFLDYAKKLYAILKTDEKEKLSLGLDDLIMGICNNREKACYHLKMSLPPKG